MGRLMAPQTRMAVISYPFSARVAIVHVKLGDWVRQGQALVTLQSEAVGAARADYYTALVDDQLAERAFERESMLLKGGVGSQKNYQASEAAVKVAQARLEAAEKKLHLLGFTEEQVKVLREQHEISPIITLHAPIAGKVVASRAVLGALVDQSVEILTLIDPTVLWVDAEIYERDIARIRMGQEVNLTVPAYPGEQFRGRVGYIGDVVKEDTQTIVVRADVANREARLKPGMFASVSFVLAEAARALVVPKDSVLDDDGEAMVFVVAGDRFVPRAVRLGAQTNGYWEVIDGLTEGEEVVTSGGFQLRSKLFNAVLRAGIH
jgi:cobalt-zinc-cadmium efflux system membrane fusion protein